ncbi:HD domain-containing protein [Metabacillus indicus]|uniref:HD-GYP domain-containing protein n=1 Tax=Metabacillus indicus TaxID=246786 RepID=UPI002A030238|nr:HD domain-containing phosphohydrolase [Metabacillus indicus]MDX8289309.1 HD domain-containing protein [Metabacillus indicus]
MIILGLTIGRQGTSLEKVSFDQFTISLLARGDGSEIMIQTISAGNLFYVYPSENQDVMEFFYLLQGEITCERDGEQQRLGPGDYYTAQHLAEPVHFSALTDVVYLWVITEPTFYQLSESVLALKKVVDDVEKKDRYTYKHSERVSEYAVKIAKKMSLPKERLENLYISSLLHDIGKVHTPEEILNKPASLTKEEFEVIKRHPADGAEMVEDKYYGDIAEIIRQHHERLNGSGYPRRLSGEEILIEARIIAVSDTFDAMTEDRAYRKAFSAEDAVNELIRLSGSHYDESVVHAFLNVLREEGRIS